MNAEILCVGTELLLGDTVNTNASFLAKELSQLGIHVYYQSVVGDNVGRLKEALQLALSRCDMVITTGGLGPTYDDLTKETVADYFGLEMQLDEKQLVRMRDYFDRIGREFTQNNVKQAMIPKGATALCNDNGTAPGVFLKDSGKVVIMLPGPPREMRPMFQNYAVPLLKEDAESILVSRNIHIFGMGESKLESILHEKMLASTNPTIAPYAKDGEVLLRVTASAEDEASANRMLEAPVKEITDLLGDYVYGINVGTLQNAVVIALKQKGWKVATAESCTGGLISKRITEVPGSSEVFHCGVCSYANRIKEKVCLLYTSRCV